MINFTTPKSHPQNSWGGVGHVQIHEIRVLEATNPRKLRKIRAPEATIPCKLLNIRAPEAIIPYSRPRDHDPF